MSESTRSPWQLDLDALARYPRPGTVVPGSLAFSPDSRLLTYLFSDRGDLARDLWALDVETGERRILAQPPGGGTTDENVNPEEALRRERQRLREGGITHYAWAKDADRILVPINGKLYVTSSGGESLQLVAPSDEPAADARLTPDGTRVVCVRGRELWRTDLATGETLQLTSSSSETIANGLAEFIAQEEMGRDEGFWIDPRGERVAYAHVDEGSIPDYPIVHQGEPQWRVEHHRYPFAGGPNARVRLGVVGIDGGVTTWLDLGPDPEVYLARVDWSPLGRLFVQLEQRDQQRLELWRYDVSQGTRTLLLVEATRPWVNLHHDLRFVGETETFTWSSEGSGYRQLSLHDPDGSELCDLTSGERPVERLLHVDAERRRAYYTAPGSSPLTRYVWSVSLDANVPRYATTDARDSPPGFHGAVFSPNGSYWAHSFDSGTQAPTVTLESVDGGERRVIHQGESIQQVMPGVRPPDLVQLAA
ncbi:MAG: dipeptidyl-peptidase 4, partial [Chloroflexota bacterium]|nr:dipeptidyl-peptidase 4 [Chloroflexota bacterium]